MVVRAVQRGARFERPRKSRRGHAPRQSRHCRVCLTRRGLRGVPPGGTQAGSRVRLQVWERVFSPEPGRNNVITWERRRGEMARRGRASMGKGAPAPARIVLDVAVCRVDFQYGQLAGEGRRGQRRAAAHAAAGPGGPGGPEGPEGGDAASPHVGQVSPVLPPRAPLAVTLATRVPRPHPVAPAPARHGRRRRLATGRAGAGAVPVPVPWRAGAAAARPRRVPRGRFR